MRAPAAIGLVAAIAGIAADQAHKAWMLGPFAIDMKGRAPLTPFLDLVLVWNRGVSYGLFSQDGELGRLVLTGIGILGSLLFTWWLFRAERVLSGLALGLVIAGAFSNAIDRMVHGAVADFFLFHVGDFEWYVFNLADVWIVAGIVGLLLAWATERPKIAKEA